MKINKIVKLELTNEEIMRLYKAITVLEYIVSELDPDSFFEDQDKCLIVNYESLNNTINTINNLLEIGSDSTNWIRIDRTREVKEIRT